jgi:hypothetical protein
VFDSIGALIEKVLAAPPVTLLVIAFNPLGASPLARPTSRRSAISLRHFR